MVAYSFKPRFAPLIVEGMKTQTIRAPRQRHARPGEDIQLFTGMRTAQCKRIATVRCTDVLAVEIWFEPNGQIGRITTDGLPVWDLDAFAVRDGFADAADMAAFWAETHGRGGQFTGVLIEWAAPQEGFGHG